MATFVLVHGAWHGTWSWRRVARRLVARGHDVFSPTLTGVGERSHLLTRDIDLDTHVLDVVNEIRWQELKDVVLVGHSYAGMVVSGVAEKVPDAIASFVMLDAFFPDDGQMLLDLLSPEVRETFLAIGRTGASTLPPLSAAEFLVNGDDRAWVDAQCTPHPLKCFTQGLALTGARERIGTRAYVRATSYPSVPFDDGAAKARDRGWAVYEVASGHDVMLDAPDRLTDILVELV